MELRHEWGLLKLRKRSFHIFGSIKKGRRSKLNIHKERTLHVMLDQIHQNQQKWLYFPLCELT